MNTAGHPWRTPQLIGELQDAGVRVVSATEPEYDVNTVMGMWMQKVMEAKNASYSMEVAFHTRKGMRQNANARDPESGLCYKNGGRPAWGYRTVRKERTDVRGRPRFKAVWELDEAEAVGRPLWQWTRGMLVRAGEGASLDSLRDWLNDAGLLNQDGNGWSTSTIHSTLEPHMLLQYAGFGTWAVRKKRRRQWNEPADWEVVPDAHPAIISEAEAKAIGRVREEARKRHSNRTRRMTEARSAGSRYLLSGGPFRCGRCGAATTGDVNNGISYYVCGTVKYRRGVGCGSGVLVPKDLLEQKVWDLVREWCGALAVRGGESAAREVNAELRAAWLEAGGDKAAKERQRLQQVEKAIASLRSALEKGVDDVEWVNRRLQELREEQEALVRGATGGLESGPPEVDVETVRRYAADLPELLKAATNDEKRVLAQAFVGGITLDPECRELQVGLRARLLSPMCGGGGRSRTGE